MHSDEIQLLFFAAVGSCDVLVCFSLKLMNGGRSTSGVLAAQTHSTMGKKELWKVPCHWYKAKNKPLQDNHVYPQIKTG